MAWGGFGNVTSGPTITVQRGQEHLLPFPGAASGRWSTQGATPASTSSLANAGGGNTSSMYDEAKRMLGDVAGLYQAGGAWDQAFEQSKRKASDAALAQSVQAGMANVYNPQASGAAFEAEARPSWELGRMQGLSSAMTNMANLQAGRASELYQGGIQQASIDAGLASAGVQSAAQQNIARIGNQADLDALRMKLNSYGKASKLPASPFASGSSIWG